MVDGEASGAPSLGVGLCYDASADLVPVSEISTPGVYDVHKINTPTHLSLAEIERAHIQRVLESCEGNIAKATRSLGINRVTLYKRIAEYGGE